VARPAEIELPKDRPADLPLPDLHAPITGLSTDSRTIRPGQVFVALRGEHFDGHGFVADAAKAGSPLVVLEDADAVPPGGLGGCGVIRVADTGKALLKLAAAYRASLKRTKVVAVCGSNGKTTTVRLIEHLLRSTGMRGTASAKSFNNAVGVPLTVLSAKENDQYLICEIGTNHPGEIAALAETVRPDLAVITSIGREHLEGLGDLTGVAAEEASVLKFLAPGGWAIVNGDARELDDHLKGIKSLVTFGHNPGATLRLGDAAHRVEGGKACVEFSINGRQRCRLGLVGEHNAMNALAALAVARRLGVDEQKAVAALATAGGAGGGGMRLEIADIAGVIVINDAYNANPDSMIAGIRTVVGLAKAGMGNGRVVCVLGEMLELGAASGAGHCAVASSLDASGIDLAVLVGAGMKAAQKELVSRGWGGERLKFFENAEGTNAVLLASLLRPGDLVLVKGSRRVRLERVVAEIGHAAPHATSAPTAPSPPRADRWHESHP